MSINKKINFHALAHAGKLNQIDPKFLIAENLLNRNLDGLTAIHIASYSKHLDQIPKELLTKENLTLKNYSGSSILHIAAINGNLKQLPYEFLSQNEDACIKVATVEAYQEALKIAKERLVKEIKEQIPKKVLKK
jgi:ankyrin repeat protein